MCVCVCVKHTSMYVSKHILEVWKDKLKKKRKKNL